MIKNKAQVTLFILIGIVIAIGAVVLLYINSEIAKKEVAPGVKVSVEKLPREFQPVASFVESCVKSVGVSALRKIGQTGGFGYVANTNPLNPTESSAVELSSGSGLNIAYWYHLKDSNKCTGICTFSLSRPFLHKKQGEPSIEAELEKYVDENIDECFGNFEVFSKQEIGIIPLGSIKTDVYVTDDNVAFILNYPLKLQREGAEKTAEQFYAEVPLKLKKMYELANYITGLEASNSFLERHVLNLIVGFSGVDENKLPPIADFRFGSSSKVRWIKSNVKQNIIDMLTYIQLLQVYGTKNYEEIDVYSELGNALYNEGMLIPSDGSFNDLEVSFDYLEWHPYFELNCRGELCEPESMSFRLLQIFGMQNYNFVYDLSFPVLVSISDPDALFDEGYVLQFMLEGNIRSNEPMKVNFTPIDAVGAEETLFCDVNKRNSGIVTINVTSPDDIPLDDVQVGYSCAGQNCFIGETKQGVLEAKFPICLGGIVSLSKQDYLGSYTYLDTEVGKEVSLDVVVEPIRERRITVRKKLVEKMDVGTQYPMLVWSPTLREEELGENEEAIVTLTRKSSVNDEYMTTAILNGPQEQDISLYSGEYDIDIVVMSKDRLVIPERTEKAGGFLGFGEKEYTLPGITFNESSPYISGGLKLNYEFTKEDLDSDVIVLYAVGIDFKGVPEGYRVIEDLEEMGKIEEYSEAYGGALSPGFE